MKTLYIFLYCAEYMPRKPIPDFKIQQIIHLAASGELIKEIARITELSIPTVNQYRKKYEKEIAREREENGLKPEPPQAPRARKLTPAPAPAPEEESEEDQDPILEKAVPEFVKQSGGHMSKEMTARFKDALAAGLSVMDYQMKYLRSLQEMGIAWEKFVDFSFQLGYDTIEEEYIRQLEQHRIEEHDLELQLKEGLAEQENEADEDEAIRKYMQE
jgi:transposase